MFIEGRYFVSESKLSQNNAIVISYAEDSEYGDEHFFEL